MLNSKCVTRPLARVQKQPGRASPNTELRSITQKISNYRIESPTVSPSISPRNPIVRSSSNDEEDDYAEYYADEEEFYMCEETSNDASRGPPDALHASSTSSGKPAYSSALGAKKSAGMQLLSFSTGDLTRTDGLETMPVLGSLSSDDVMYLSGYEDRRSEAATNIITPIPRFAVPRFSEPLFIGEVSVGTQALKAGTLAQSRRSRSEDQITRVSIVQASQHFSPQERSNQSTTLSVSADEQYLLEHLDDVNPPGPSDIRDTLTRRSSFSQDTCPTLSSSPVFWSLDSEKENLGQGNIRFPIPSATSKLGDATFRLRDSSELKTKQCSSSSQQLSRRAEPGVRSPLRELNSGRINRTKSVPVKPEFYSSSGPQPTRVPPIRLSAQSTADVTSCKPKPAALKKTLSLQNALSLSPRDCRRNDVAVYYSPTRKGSRKSRSPRHLALPLSRPPSTPAQLPSLTLNNEPLLDMASLSKSEPILPSPDIVLTEVHKCKFSPHT